MLKDTKNYLLKYWKEWMVILVTIFVTLFLSVILMIKMNNEYTINYSNLDKLSACTGNLYNLTENSESEFSKWYGGTFNYYQDYRKKDGCKYTKEEIDVGLDEIYLKFFERFVKIDENNQLEEKLNRFLEIIIYEDRDISDNDFFAKHKLTTSDFFSPEDLKDINTRNDLLLGVLKKRLEIGNNTFVIAESMSTELKNDNILDIIQKLMVSSGDKINYYLMLFLFTSTLTFAVFGIICLIIYRFVKNKWLRIIFGTTIFVSIALVLFNGILMLSDYITLYLHLFY